MSRTPAPVGGSEAAWARLPFTTVTLATLCLTALVSRSHRQPLPAGWLRRGGYAPRDLRRLRLQRLATSALLTHGRGVFVRALAMVAIGVGASERRLGTVTTAAVFWGTHAASLVALSLPRLPASQRRASSPPRTPRDVGPSAGALGCIGAFIGSQERTTAAVATTAATAVLAATLAAPPAAGVSRRLKRQADCAHLLALPLGLAAGWAWRRNRLRRRS